MIFGNPVVMAVCWQYRAEQRTNVKLFDKDGKITRQINGFHSKPANVEMTPKDTAVTWLSVSRADADGNIFSIYAFCNLGNVHGGFIGDEPMILRFDPDWEIRS